MATDETTSQPEMPSQPVTPAVPHPRQPLGERLAVAESQKQAYTARRERRENRHRAACAALTGMLSGQSYSGKTQEEFAVAAVQQADALLAELKKPKADPPPV